MYIDCDVPSYIQSIIYYILIKIRIHSSCEIEYFVETHHCKLCVILHSLSHYRLLGTTVDNGLHHDSYIHTIRIYQNNKKDSQTPNIIHHQVADEVNIHTRKAFFVGPGSRIGRGS